MSNLFMTLVIAFIVIVLAIACLAIGWLITGKSKIVRGACGMKPDELRKDNCGNEMSCSVCEDPKEKGDAKHAKRESEKKHDV